MEHTMESRLKDLMLRVARLERQADLNPPLGSQPPCTSVMERAKSNGAGIDDLIWVKNTLNELPLYSSPEGVKMLKDVKRRDSNRFYRMTYPRPLIEESSSTPIKKRKPFIEAFEINAHTQFRMDLRGITVRHIDLALRDFQKRGDSQGRIEKAEEAEREYAVGKDWGVSKRELDVRLGEKKKIKHECKVQGKMLTIWFIPMSRKGGKVVSIKTAFWSGLDNPTLDC